MIYLNPKNAGDTADYLVAFDDIIPADFSMVAASVSVDSAGNTESPLTLEAQNAFPSTDLSPPSESKGVLFELTEGTPMTWYLLLVRVTVQKGSKARLYSKYVKVQVRDDL